MQIYDISLTISSELPIWPGDSKILVERVEKMEDGSAANVSRLSMSAHAGTHVDAPFHFLGGDAPTVERLPLGVLTGRAYVLRLGDEVDLVTASVLEQAGVPARTRRLLIKTRNSDLWTRREKEFHADFVAISEDGARYLVQRGVKLVGVDYLSVGPYDQGAPTHEILLEAGVVALEGLDLSGVESGKYTLYCLPLKVAGADGAPARAILIGE
jgi:arylformamidase